LQQFQEKGKAAVPALRKALKDPDGVARQQAAYALAAIGPDAKAALPDLKEALKDKDQNVVAAAQQAIQQINQ
jgi:HEAT repeat protein